MNETERDRSVRLALRSTDAEAALKKANDENACLRNDRQWLIRAADCIAASAEWFADVKGVPKSEMRRHYQICEDIHDALARKMAPPSLRRSDADVMERLAGVAKRLRERVGESS